VNPASAQKGFDDFAAPSLHEPAADTSRDGPSWSINGRQIVMNVNPTRTWLAMCALACGCGVNYAVPSQQLSDAQSAERSATELGAATEPNAQLHLQLAHEQITAANAAIRDGDNERAGQLLSRARADAELSIALTRERTAKADAEKALTQSNNQRVTNANQCAQP
jgi:biotin-(acetyl-CoA carboxylase) ligase